MWFHIMLFIHHISDPLYYDHYTIDYSAYIHSFFTVAISMYVYRVQEYLCNPSGFTVK